MLKIIRSVRSDPRREQIIDDDGATSRSSKAQEDSSQLPCDMHPNRSSIARSAIAGVRRHRLSRSGYRSTMEVAGSENVALEKQRQPLALGGCVLGDVTNTFAGGEVDGQPKLSFGEAAICEPRSARLDSMSATTTSSDELDHDAKHGDDPQYVMEYMNDIFCMMQRNEALHEASPDYMQRQLHVNAKMRGILVDWLVSVQVKYKLESKTLFLAINLLDRYLGQTAAARRHLQLVGVTVLLIAAKFEEIYPPEISVLVYITDNTYSREDIIKMEVSILTALDFKICCPTPMHFLERYQDLNGCSESHSCMAQYLVELTLPEYTMLKYSASSRAASAVFLSSKLLCHQPAWKPAAVKHSGFTETMLKDCAKEMCALLENADSNTFQAVRKKFSQPKYQSVAKLDFSGACPTGQTAEELSINLPRRSLGGDSSLRPRSSNAYLAAPVPCRSFAAEIGERRRSMIGSRPSSASGLRLPPSSQGTTPQFLERGRGTFI